MRENRIKVNPDQDEAVYNLMSRVVNRERLLDPEARDVLRRQLLVVAEYCGITVFTYSVLSSHFHVFVSAPRRQRLTDEELLRRYQILHPKPTPYCLRRIKSIQAMLVKNGPEADAWRRSEMKKMCDVSQYMKLVKQRFTLWFNKARGRIGTLWAERFKSVLVERIGGALRTIAAYIDLNPVRAGMISDPKDYRCCGYADAVAGNKRIQAALTELLGESNWTDAQATYRLLLFGSGSVPKENCASISEGELERVLKSGGTLPLTTVLRCRLRHFTESAVVGSLEFVSLKLKSFRRRSIAKPLPPLTDWFDLATNRLRGKHLG